MIYLDNAATTQVHPWAGEIFKKYSFENYCNAGGKYKLGKEAKNAIENAREKIAKSLNAKPDNIIFTSCGSESNTLAIVGLANHLKEIEKTHIITTKYEHPSVLNSMHEMERRGFEVTYLDVPNGVVDIDDFKNNIRKDTGLVSIMYTNNELGTVNDVNKIYILCKENGIIFHSDCVQAISTEDIDMFKTADMVSISGHKIHCMKGIGLLCAKNKEFLSNIIFGGGQEFGIRPGTENVASIVMMAEMIDTFVKYRDRNYYYCQHLKKCFIDEIKNSCNQYGIQFAINADSERNSPKIISLMLPGVDNESLMMMLDNENICVSSGSACSSNKVTPSHVLKSIYLDDNLARSTIRISFSMFNKPQEVCYAARTIVKCAKILRETTHD